jgi:hypothetical protein
MDGENEVNLLNLIDNVNIDKLSSTLKEIEKYEKLIDKISGIITKLNNIGVIPAIVRIVGKKADVTNIDAPLPQISPLSIEATSSTHLLLYKQLNEQSEENIANMFKNAVLIEQENLKLKEQEEKEIKKNEDRTG